MKTSQSMSRTRAAFARFLKWLMWSPENWPKWWQRAVSAIVIVMLVLVLLEYLKRNFLPQNGTIKLEAPGGYGLAFTQETSRGTEQTSILMVPAYRMATPTGVQIQPGDDVIITASGTIATSSSFGEWLGTNANPAIDDTKGYVMSALERAHFERDSNPNWRGPDGNRLFDKDGGLEPLFFASDTNSESIYKAHERHKLRPNRNYGLLMGCIISEDEKNHIGEDNIKLIQAVFAHRADIFSIGKSCEFRCVHERHATYLDFQKQYHYSTNGILLPETNTIPMEETSGELVLLVNDVIMTKEALRDLATNNVAMRGGYLMTSNIFASKLASNMRSRGIDFETFAKELWYWDNVGSFTVTVRKSKASVKREKEG